MHAPKIRNTSGRPSYAAKPSGANHGFADGGRILHDSLRRHGVDGGDGRSGGQRMARVGQATARCPSSSAVGMISVSLAEAAAGLDEAALERLLGVALEDPESRTSLHVAVLLHDLAGR